MPMSTRDLVRGLIVASFFLNPAWAATPEGSSSIAGVLTWQDCIGLAARNNPDLLSALRAMEASRAQYYGSFNGLLPHLSISNSYVDSSSSRDALLSTGT